jgi:hypothetical protein
MLIINGKKPARKLNVYVNGKRKTSGGGAPPAPLYQEWSGYPDSPVLTSEHPYQVILKVGTGDYDPILIVSPFVWWWRTLYGGDLKTDGAPDQSDSHLYKYIHATNQWSFYNNQNNATPIPASTLGVYQCNADILNADKATVWKAKTTP